MLVLHLFHLFFAGSTLVAVVSTDDGAAGGVGSIASIVGVFSILLSLAAVPLRGMIDVVAVDSQREEEGQRSRCYR